MRNEEQIKQLGDPTMSQEKSQAFHIVAFEFTGRDRAKEVMEMIRKGGRANDYKVPAWAVVEVDDKGKPHVKQSGHGGIGTAVGTGVGALLGLVGGPAGLLVWALGGALIGGLAGKYMGHHFDAGQLKALTTDMGPNTSAILVVVEDKLAENMATQMGEYGAKIVTVTMGSQVSGEVATYAAVAVGENGETADEKEAEEAAPPNGAAKPEAAAEAKPAMAAEAKSATAA
jgi:uncharacterized membrane protein